MFCFRTQEDAKIAKIFTINAIAGEVAGYARQESAEAGGNQWHIVYSFGILPLRSPVVVKLTTSLAPA